MILHMLMIVLFMVFAVWEVCAGSWSFWLRRVPYRLVRLRWLSYVCLLRVFFNLFGRVDDAEFPGMVGTAKLRKNNWKLRNCAKTTKKNTCTWTIELATLRWLGAARPRGIRAIWASPRLRTARRRRCIRAGASGGGASEAVHLAVRPEAVQPDGAAEAVCLVRLRWLSYVSWLRVC